MKIAAFRLKSSPNAPQVGLVTAEGPVVALFDLPPEQRALGAQAIVELQAQGLPLPATTQVVGLDEVELDAPFPRPRRNIFCVGKNYHAHAKEFAGSGFDSSAKVGGDIPSVPIIFTKVPESVTGPHGDIVIPAGVTNALDYEVELAVIVGRGGKGIRKADAMHHVWGYTVINDATARDWQQRHLQWHLGKSFDTFCPMGPWAVSADECDGTKTRVRTWINGELRQDQSTADLIFDIPTLIETISAGITLYPGDIIATGTPVGVGIGFKPPKYLKPGDVVKMEIDGIGAIENKVR